jgi:hypothetical protein
LATSIRSRADRYLARRGDPRLLKLDHGHRVTQAGQNLPHRGSGRGTEATALKLDPHPGPIEEPLTLGESQLAASRNRQPVEVIAD